MELIQSKLAIREVAQKEGITEQGVIAEMEAAIKEAYAQALASGDEKMAALWKGIPRVGTVPSAAELVAYIAERITSNQTAPV